MAFHEVQFPPSISYGSSGGPGFSTSIIEGEGGASERVSRWSNARRHYNAKPGIRSQDAIAEVLDFYIARQGPAIGFRWKDWTDFTTAANHRDTPTATDVLLGVATGTSGQFQLRTKYVSGPTTTYRTITKPVSGTLLMATNGNALATGNYSVDYATGLVTVTAGLTNEHQVTAGFEFDVPVQFAGELDESFDISIDNYNWSDIPDINLIEMTGDISSPERFYTGGATQISTAATTSLNFTYGRALVYTSAAAATWLLPDPSDLELGGPYFYIYNFSSGGSSITLRTYDNNPTPVTTVLSARIAVLCVYNDGTNNKWAVLSS